MKTFKILLCVLGVFMIGATLLITAEPAMADGSVDWTGHGDENLPCSAGMHIIFTPGGGGNTVSAATVYVNGDGGHSMSQSGSGSWSADVLGSFDASLSMYVTYIGDLGSGSAGIQLSHCLEENPTETPEPTFTSTPTDTPTPDPTGTVTPDPTGTPNPHPTPTPQEQNTAGGGGSSGAVVLLFIGVLSILAGIFLPKKAMVK